ncbi:MAG: glycosyltransferase family 2 protein [Clostridiales bacterium]|nr:glycosyltransferase family 2 protein [Clostridiales bacterium]
MKIQNLMLPQMNVCMESELFYRSSEMRNLTYSPDEDKLIFCTPHAHCDFTTYFNSLSIGKWRKYTHVGAVSLHVVVDGHFMLTSQYYGLQRGCTTRRAGKTVEITGNGATPVMVVLEPQPEDILIGFHLTALETGCAFLGGWYEGETNPALERKVNLAVNICTFRREAYMMRNLKMLKERILDNTESPLVGHLHVFVSDNGHTLPMEELNSDVIHVVPNKNVGGAGGFTRGLIEIMHSDYPATHAIMMDDDIVIESEALERTFALLRCRRDEYADMFVGGAMLRLDQPYRQVESGATWNAGKLISNKAGFDMRELYCCIANEVDERCEYNAWWYCCTPMSVVNPENLPLPIFIRGDDLEYGLRNMKTLVLMNGICVWHEPFEFKYSSCLQYYILRNLLYCNALHFIRYDKWRFLVKLYRNMARELVYYRYQNIDLLDRGVRDFYKGVDFLLTTDGEKLHSKIIASGYKSVPVEELSCTYDPVEYAVSLHECDGRVAKILRLMSGNGYLLPARRRKPGDTKPVSMATCRPYNYFRERTILNYDETSGKAFITHKSYRELFRCLGVAARLTCTTLRHYTHAVEDFRKESQRVTNEAFWKKYLGI